MASRWADLPVIRDTESGIAAIEREQMTKPRPLEVEEPALHQPSNNCLSAESHFKDCFIVDEVTKHSIKLIQYCHQLQVLINSAKQQIEALRSGELKTCSFPALPPLPICREPKMKQRLLKPIPFLQKDVESAFACGIGCQPSEISYLTCRQLLKRSVAAICAHASYNSSMEKCIDVLADALHEYMMRMTQLLRVAVDDEALGEDSGAGGSSDVISRVFHEIGAGSPTVVHDYYQCRILNYQTRFMLMCHQLQREYRCIIQPNGSNPALGQTSASWTESSIRDIHFPNSEDTDDVGYTEQMLPLDNFDANASQEADCLTTSDYDSCGRVYSSGRVTSRPRQATTSNQDVEDRKKQMTSLQ